MAQFLSMAFLGFFLGMRHATDPDHVVAVTTMVGRAGGIGILWGVGHTVTILLVGGGILLFNVVIPPRIGLAMDFSVAVMLVLLGVLSLGRIARAATPLAKGDRWFV